jgi:PAS domain-containing protein
MGPSRDLWPQMVANWHCSPDTGHVTEGPVRARDRGDLEAGVDAARLPARTSAVEAVRIVLWAAAFALTFWAGHRTIADDSGFALFWPASGVAAVWFATSAFARPRSVEIVLLGAVAAGTSYALGQSGWHVLEAFVGAPTAAVVFVVLARRWLPELWTAIGPRELNALREYGALVGAALVAGLAESLVALATLLPEPGLPFEPAGEIAITHTIAMVTLGGAGITVAGWLGALPAGPTRVGRLLAGIRHGSTRKDAVLGALVTAFAVVAFLAGYVWFAQAPVSFVLVMVVVAVAIRFSATTTAVFCMAIVGTACWLTVAGHGPIAALPDPHRRALAFGLFVTAITITGLTIALSRRERDATIVRLRESERATEVVADDLGLVLANLEEGVAVVEEGGRFIHANPAIGRLLEMPDFDDRQV